MTAISPLASSLICRRKSFYIGKGALFKLQVSAKILPENRENHIVSEHIKVPSNHRTFGRDLNDAFVNLPLCY